MTALSFATRWPTALSIKKPLVNFEHLDNSKTQEALFFNRTYLILFNPHLKRHLHIRLPGRTRGAGRLVRLMF